MKMDAEGFMGPSLEDFLQAITILWDRKRVNFSDGFYEFIFRFVTLKLLHFCAGFSSP